MKPALGMESGKADTVTVVGMNVPDKDVAKRFSSKRIVVGVIAAVVVMVTIAAIVLLSVHFGSKITTESFKVVHQTLKSDKGGVIEEETTITETEVDVRIPNVAEVIYDYENGIVVTRFVDRETNVKGECLAQYMNETIVPNRDPDEYSDAEVDMYENGDNEDEKTEKYVKTDDEVPENLISENVARACRGTKIYWIRKVENHNGAEMKRQACSQVNYYAICFKINYQCAYKCLFVNHCKDTNSISLSTGYGCKVGCVPWPNNAVCPHNGRPVNFL